MITSSKSLETPRQPLPTPTHIYSSSSSSSSSSIRLEPKPKNHYTDAFSRGSIDVTTLKLIVNRGQLHQHTCNINQFPYSNFLLNRPVGGEKRRTKKNNNNKQTIQSEIQSIWQRCSRFSSAATAYRERLELIGIDQPGRYKEKQKQSTSPESLRWNGPPAACSPRASNGIRPEASWRSVAMVTATGSIHGAPVPPPGRHNPKPSFQQRADAHGGAALGRSLSPWTAANQRPIGRLKPIL